MMASGSITKDDFSLQSRLAHIGSAAREQRLIEFCVYNVIN